MIELKPCPFCGNEYISVIPSVDKTAWWCKCEECEVTTPCYHNKDAAITAWNRRENDA